MRLSAREERGALRGPEGRDGGVSCPVWLIKAESCALLHPTVSSPPSASVYFNNVYKIVTPLQQTQDITCMQPLSKSEHSENQDVRAYFVIQHHLNTLLPFLL